MPHHIRRRINIHSHTSVRAHTLAYMPLHINIQTHTGVHNYSTFYPIYIIMHALALICAHICKLINASSYTHAYALHVHKHTHTRTLF